MPKPVSDGCILLSARATASSGLWTLIRKDMRALQRLCGPEVQMSKDSFEDVEGDIETLGWTYGTDRLPPVEPCQSGCDPLTKSPAKHQADRSPAGLVNRIAELLHAVLSGQMSDLEWNELPSRPRGGYWEEPSV